MSLVSYMRYDGNKTDVFGRYNFNWTQGNFPSYPANTGINGAALFDASNTEDMRDATVTDMGDYENMTISFRMNPQFDYHNNE